MIEEVLFREPLYCCIKHAERATVRPPEKSCPVMLLLCCVVVVVVLLACLHVIGPRRRAVMHPKLQFPHIQKWELLDEHQRVGKIAG